MRESHVDINTHTVITPLLSILFKTFTEEVGFCRLNIFTEVAATVRVIKGVTMKESILRFLLISNRFNCSNTLTKEFGCIKYYVDAWFSWIYTINTQDVNILKCFDNHKIRHANLNQTADNRYQFWS